MTGRRRARGRAPNPKGQLGFWIIVAVLLFIVLVVFFGPIIAFM